MLERGFSTQALFDTKNPDLLKEDKYFFIKNLEVYHTDDRIIGFFPFFGDRVTDKKIKQDSYYNQFMKNLKNIKKILKQKNINLKQDIIYLEEPLNNIKVVFDENSQNITSIKIVNKGNPIIFGNQKETKDKYVTLFKKNHFISGMKTSYLNSKDNIPNLSFIKCYFGKNEEINKYLSSNKTGGNLLKYIFFPFIFIFKIIYCILYLSFTLILLIVKLSLILIILISPPLYIYYKTQNIYKGNYIISNLNSEYEIKNNDTIKIYTDDYGFPHIKGNSLEDIYFGLGFAQAKNRLWQIDINRRIARGMLSEIFGEKTVETDKFMRRIGHNEFAKKQAKFVENNSEYYNIIKAFIAGINYFANNLRGLDYKVL